ncbi:PTS sugar transporter subunit IIC [Lactobacillus sp. ESL0791]|uniref:PTS mannose/fructose/sorbose/N-acetylgalactosamine transporter subunit IIC n=1 Tax=Lactobacillus sp. ESL0791 TaxID=2983234 RepID=UPI0023F771AA|nr:PTS sugar transporter subunit IIC [Lactobacillus sp. ESL0791]MDF7638260.1 PTS sugar transporter subunit IIC [Lactobacillus sp. ESL0791]
MNGLLFFRALLVGIFCYLGAVDTPWVYGVVGGFYILGRPLIAGFVCGIIFGDVKAGILCGLAVQAVFIASMHTGGTSNTEITFAGYGGIGLAMATTKDPAIAVALALFIGQTFGLIFYNLKMAGFSYFNRKAEQACQRGDEHGLLMQQIVYPQIVQAIVRIVPVWLAIYLGADAVKQLIAIVPKQITDIVTLLGGVLPALGIAMLMNILIKQKSQLIFFLFGFALVAFSKMSIIGLVFIAVTVAYVLFLSSGNKSKAQPQAEAANPSATATNSGDYEDDDMF